MSSRPSSVSIMLCATGSKPHCRIASISPSGVKYQQCSAGLKCFDRSTCCARCLIFDTLAMFFDFTPQI